MDQHNSARTEEAKTPHLAPALLAVVLMGIGLMIWVYNAKRLEKHYIHALAPQVFEQKLLGTALQDEAYAQPDLLPFYGSSEMRVANPEHASTLFRNYPTGFTVYPVGKPGTTCLVMLQDLAAVGSGAKGKKVALSLTPSWFFEGGSLDAAAYAGNFSRLHAGELAFSSDLSDSVKREVAQRMMAYPDTLKGDALLRFAVQNLVEDSAWSRCLYYAAWPLGKMQNFILRLQDHAETAAFIRGQPFLSDQQARQEQNLEWPRLLQTAEREYAMISNNNPFGFLNGRWRNNWKAKAERVKGTRSDQEFLTVLEKANEWKDLELLLRTMEDLGIEPLILSMPIHGKYYDHWGISKAARQVYYDRIQSVMKARGVSAVLFTDLDANTDFLIDHGHLSHKGWLNYDYALNQFFHGEAPKPLTTARQSVETKRPVETRPQESAKPKAKENPKASENPKPNYDGHLDVVDEKVISGWAWEPAQPDRAVKLTVYDGNKLVANIVADQLRNDLRRDGKGNGKHAFFYPVPDKLKDGKMHEIRVQVAGTGIHLTNSPKSVRMPAK
jgi:D-alanine transfer protein